MCIRIYILRFMHVHLYIHMYIYIYIYIYMFRRGGSFELHTMEEIQNFCKGVKIFCCDNEGKELYTYDM
jgi:hypothetical protein